MGVSQQLCLLTREFSREVDALSFSSEEVTVYNPLDYAREPHESYMRRFVNSTKRTLFLGMNPGPWGMAQTGVPFGEIGAVRDWMGISGTVGRPQNEHPKRPVTGFATERSEVSGKRLWSLMQQRFGTPEAFAVEHAVMNYCPLVFMERSGKNLTPDKLPAADRKPLERCCDDYLISVIGLLEPEFVVGVGKYAEKKLSSIIKTADLRVNPEVCWVLHPSPASPAANRGWAEAAVRQLLEQGIWE